MTAFDAEDMDKIVNDLKTAVHGLGVSVTFKSMDLIDVPTVMVYVSGENIGSLMWTTNDLNREVGYEWFSVSLLTFNTRANGNSVRAALARLLNDYIDKRVGLI